MSKKNYPENIQKLKTQLESGNHLIDYFLVCGVNPDLCLDDNNLFNLSDDKNANYHHFSKILKPKIITKFPEFDNNNDTIDDEIISYCFINGFKPYYNDTGDKKRPKCFSIILDNNLFSSEYPQKYLTCFLFYEQITQYKSLADDIRKVKNNLDIGATFISEESNNNKMNRNSFKKTDASKNFSHIKTTTSIAINTLNINEMANNTDSTFEESKTIISSTQSNTNSKLYKLKYYFIPKCICIVSIHPYIKLFKDILSLIYNYSLSTQQIPLEKIISNLIIEVPIAPRGLYSIDFMLVNKNITLKRSENNKLLLSEIDLRKFHKNIQFNIQIEVFKHILFGSKIMFFCKNINNLCETILSFLTLIFPFKYPFQVSSYLNSKNYNILESISPFFLGINEAYNAEFFSKNDISTEGMDLFIVDLDNNTTDLISDEAFPDFPIKLINNLDKEIKGLEKKISEEKKDKNTEDNIEGFNRNYQEIYLYFFCELIKNYEEYLNMNYFKNTENDIVTSIETLFNCNQFIKSHSSSDIPFYTKFVNDSQLFADFIYKRMIPKNNQELIDILLVNDILIQIKNKNKFFGKEQTDFSDSDKYKQRNKYIVPKARELSEKEKLYIKKHKDKLSEKGQIIKIQSTGQTDTILFKYNLFPELDFDIYCNNDNANEYCPPPDYSEEIEAINIDVISQSSLGQNINRSLEMKNYLYLSWLEVWAFSFWYIDKNERHYRFNQMLDVLDKVKHHEMNILNMLFDALNKSTENEMLLKLYRKLLELNINPSSFIYNIISGVLDKAQMRQLKDKKKSSEMKLSSNFIFKFKDYNIKDNRKRTFLSIDDYLQINTKLKFFSEFYCIECGEKINLLNICKTFDDVKNDILWIPCTSCREYNLPKIKVRFGTEMLREKLIKTSTSDEIVVHSPYNLKINIKDAVMNNYGTKLNVLDFKMHFKPLFWNFIWYCKIHCLDYTILLPYLKDIEEYQRINFKNSANDVFEVIYEDKLYKENLKKISKYSNSIYEKYVNSQKKKNSTDYHVIEQINSFEISGMDKPKTTLKNIDLNEDEEENEEKEENNKSEEKNNNNENMEINNNNQKGENIKNEDDKKINEENNKDEGKTNNIEQNNATNENNKSNEENKKDEESHKKNEDETKNAIEESKINEENNDNNAKLYDNNIEEKSNNIEEDNKNIEEDNKNIEEDNKNIEEDNKNIEENNKNIEEESNNIKENNKNTQEKCNNIVVNSNNIEEENNKNGIKIEKDEENNNIETIEKNDEEVKKNNNEKEKMKNNKKESIPFVINEDYIKKDEENKKEENKKESIQFIINKDYIKKEEINEENKKVENKKEEKNKKTTEKSEINIKKNKPEKKDKCKEKNKNNEEKNTQESKSKENKIEEKVDIKKNLKEKLAFKEKKEENQAKSNVENKYKKVEKKTEEIKKVQKEEKNNKVDKGVININEIKNMRESIEKAKILEKNKDKKNEVKSNKNSNTNTNKKESNKNLKETTKNEIPELKKNINANSNTNNKLKENELLSKLNKRKGLNNIPPKKELNNKANDNNNFLLEIRKKLKKVNNTNTESNETKQSNIKNIDPNTEYGE